MGHLHIHCLPLKKAALLASRLSCWCSTERYACWLCQWCLLLGRWWLWLLLTEGHSSKSACGAALCGVCCSVWYICGFCCAAGNDENLLGSPGSLEEQQAGLARWGSADVVVLIFADRQRGVLCSGTGREAGQWEFSTFASGVVLCPQLVAAALVVKSSGYPALGTGQGMLRPPASHRWPGHAVMLEHCDTLQAVTTRSLPSALPCTKYRDGR